MLVGGGGLGELGALGDASEAATAGEVASNTATALRLQKQLAEEELYSEAQNGIGYSMAGKYAVRSRSIDDVQRLVRQYGGQIGDWSKMSVNGARKFSDGTTLEVHWYENDTLGLRVEFKQKWGRYDISK